MPTNDEKPEKGAARFAFTGISVVFLIFAVIIEAHLPASDGRWEQFADCSFLLALAAVLALLANAWRER